MTDYNLARDVTLLILDMKNVGARLTEIEKQLKELQNK